MTELEVIVDDEGYEWTVWEGEDYWRTAGSDEEWTLYEGAQGHVEESTLDEEIEPQDSFDFFSDDYEEEFEVNSYVQIFRNKKFNSIVLVSILIGAVLLMYTPEIADDDENSQEEILQMNLENLDWMAYSVGSPSDLPDCTNERIGMLYYVESNAQFYVCKTGGWNSIVIGNSLSHPAQSNNLFSLLMDQNPMQEDTRCFFPLGSSDDVIFYCHGVFYRTDGTVEGTVPLSFQGYKVPSMIYGVDKIYGLMIEEKLVYRQNNEYYIIDGENPSQKVNFMNLPSHQIVTHESSFIGFGNQVIFVWTDSSTTSLLSLNGDNVVEQIYTTSELNYFDHYVSVTDEFLYVKLRGTSSSSTQDQILKFDSNLELVKSTNITIEDVNYIGNNYFVEDDILFVCHRGSLAKVTDNNQLISIYSGRDLVAEYYGEIENCDASIGGQNDGYNERRTVDGFVVSHQFNFIFSIDEKPDGGHIYYNKEDGDINNFPSIHLQCGGKMIGYGGNSGPVELKINQNQVNLDEINPSYEVLFSKYYGDDIEYDLDIFHCDNNHFLFMNWSHSTGLEIWKYDFASQSSVLVVDLLQGPGSSYPFGGGPDIFKIWERGYSIGDNYIQRIDNPYFGEELHLFTSG